MRSGNNSPYILSLVVIDPAVWCRRGNGLTKRCAALANRMGTGGRVESILVRQHLPSSQRSGAGRQKSRNEVRKRAKPLEDKRTYEGGSSSSGEGTQQENAHNVYYGKLLTGSDGGSGGGSPGSGPGMQFFVARAGQGFNYSGASPGDARQGRARVRALLYRAAPIGEPDGRRK